jgi:hypothetical protein
MRMQTKFKFENLKRRCHLGELSVDGRIILKWFLESTM